MYSKWLRAQVHCCSWFASIALPPVVAEPGTVSAQWHTQLAAKHALYDRSNMCSMQAGGTCSLVTLCIAALDTLSAFLHQRSHCAKVACSTAAPSVLIDHH